MKDQTWTKHRRDITLVASSVAVRWSTNWYDLPDRHFYSNPIVLLRCKISLIDSTYRQIPALAFSFIVAPSLAMQSLTSKRFIQNYAVVKCIISTGISYKTRSRLVDSRLTVEKPTKVIHEGEDLN